MCLSNGILCYIHRPWAKAVFRLGSFDISCNQFP